MPPSVASIQQSFSSLSLLKLHLPISPFEVLFDISAGCQPGQATEAESKEMDAYYKHSISGV